MKKDNSELIRNNKNLIDWLMKNYSIDGTSELYTPQYYIAWEKELEKDKNKAYEIFHFCFQMYDFAFESDVLRAYSFIKTYCGYESRYKLDGESITEAQIKKDLLFVKNINLVKIWLSKIKEKTNKMGSYKKPEMPKALELDLEVVDQILSYSSEELEIHKKRIFTKDRDKYYNNCIKKKSNKIEVNYDKNKLNKVNSTLIQKKDSVETKPDYISKQKELNFLQE